MDYARNYLQGEQATGTQLAQYTLGRHKSSIRPRSSVAYMSPTVSKTV